MGSTHNRSNDAENEEARVRRKAAKTEPAQKAVATDNVRPPEVEAQALTDARLTSSANLGRKAEVLLDLQRTHGNAYVQRLMGQGALEQQDKREAVPQEVMEGIESARGRGHPMEPNARAEMEAAFGQDLTEVRVHSDTEADQLAQEVEAEAFTTGKDVFFRGGNYQPGSPQGRGLIAHELTHVVQQGVGLAPSGLQISGPSDAAEVEAGAIANIFASHPESAPSVLATPSAAIQRQAEGSAAAATPKTDGPSPAVPGAEGAAPAGEKKEMRYKLVVEGREVFLTPAEFEAQKDRALKTLRRVHERIKNHTETEQKSHKNFMENVHGTGFWTSPVAMISDQIGGVQPPPMEMWNVPLVVLQTARAAIEKSDLPTAAQQLQQAENTFNMCHTLWYTYRMGTIKGAEMAKKGLEITRDVSFGIAAGIGAAILVPVSAGVVLAAGAQAAGAGVATIAGHMLTVRSAEVMGEAGALGPEYDPLNILKKAGTNAVTAFLGALIGGVLAPLFQRALGGQIVNLSDDALREISRSAGYPVTRDIFATWAQRELAEFTADIPGTVLGEAISSVINSMETGKPIDPSEFVKRVVLQLVSGGAFRQTLGRVAARQRARQTASAEGAPASRPAPETAAAPVPAASTPPRPEAAAYGTRALPAVPPGTPTLELGAPQPVTGTKGALEPHPFRTSETAPSGLKPVGRGPTEVPLIWPEGQFRSFRTKREAARAYRDFLEADPGREAGVWRDLDTSEYIVVQGGDIFVNTVWKTHPALAGHRWKHIEHYHPGSDMGARFGSPADFEGMYNEYLGRGGKGEVIERIRWRDPETKERVHTEIGYNPDIPAFWTRYRDVDGKWQVELLGGAPPWNAGSKYRRFLEDQGIPGQMISRRLP